MADVVIAVAIDTMYLLFESVNQISDVEFFFLEKTYRSMFIKQFQNNYQPNVFSDHGHQQRIQTLRQK